VVGGLDGSNLGLFLCHALGDEDVVLGLLLLLRLDLSALERVEVAAALEAEGGDEALDLGSFGVGLSTLLLLADNLTADNILPDIVLLGQVEEPPDLGGTLGAETLGEDGVGKTGDLSLALLNDDEGEDSDIGANDATTDRLAATLTVATGTVARVAVGQEELDAVGEEDTLLHGETLLVVSTCDTEKVSLPLLSKGITRDLLSDLLVVDETVSLLVVDVEKLLSPGGGVSNVELHTCGKS